MTLSRQAKFGLWTFAAVVIAACAYFAGTVLRPDAEPRYVFETAAPAYESPSAVAATSSGGFTGFGETDGSNSRVVLSGRVIEKTEDSVTLESTLGQQTALGFGDSPPIFRLDEASSDVLRPGVTVAVRLNEARDTVESVLVLSQP